VTASYQFEHLAFGIISGEPRSYVHGQITTLKAASAHPVVASLPLDHGGGFRAFRSLRAALGIANVDLRDTKRQESWPTIRPTTGENTELVLHWAEPPDDPTRLTDAVRRTRHALQRLGCLPPPGMTRVLPKGASVHYSGTLPISPAAGIDWPATRPGGFVACPMSSLPMEQRSLQSLPRILHSP